MPNPNDQPKRRKASAPEVAHLIRVILQMFVETAPRKLLWAFRDKRGLTYLQSSAQMVADTKEDMRPHMEDDVFMDKKTGKGMVSENLLEMRAMAAIFGELEDSPPEIEIPGVIDPMPLTEFEAEELRKYLDALAKKFQLLDLDLQPGALTGTTGSTDRTS